MGLISNLISFVKSYIPPSPMGTPTTPPPRQNIQTEEGIKAALLSHKQLTKKKHQKRGRKAKNNTLTTPTKPVNALHDSTHEIPPAMRPSPPRPGSPPTKIQKQIPKRSTGGLAGLRVRIICKEIPDSPSVPPPDIMDIDDDEMGTMPIDCCADSDDLDTLMEDAPPFTLAIVNVVVDVFMAGDGGCDDVEMLDV